VNPEGAGAPEEVGEALVMGAFEVRPRGEERGAARRRRRIAWVNRRSPGSERRSLFTLLAPLRTAKQRLASAPPSQSHPRVCQRPVRLSKMFGP